MAMYLGAFLDWMHSLLFLPLSAARTKIYWEYDIHKQ